MKLGDVGVHEPGEKAALAQKAFARFAAGEIRAHELQSDALDEIVAIALGQIHAAHAAFTDQAQQTQAADARTGQIGRATRGPHASQRCGRVAFEDSVRDLLRRQKAPDFVEQLGIAILAEQPGNALAVRHRLRFAEQPLDLFPASRFGHGTAFRSIASRRQARASSQS